MPATRYQLAGRPVMDDMVSENGCGARNGGIRRPGPTGLEPGI